MDKRLVNFFLLNSAILMGCFSACNSNTQETAVKSVLKKTAVVINDSTSAKESVSDFLHWYKINYKTANNFPLITKDNAGNFIVNRKAYVAYLDYLKGSQLIAPKYIDYWKKFFVDKELELKKNKIKTDIPDGFDLDLVLITQEPEIILNTIDSLRFNIVSMNDSVALVNVKLPSDTSVDYDFEMYKANLRWQIGYISTPNYD